MTKEETKKKNRKKWLLALLLFLFMLLAGWGILYKIFYHAPEAVIANMEEIDNEFVEKMDPSQLKEYMQKQADKDYVHLKVDTKMTFKSTDEIGTVNIQNPPTNEEAIRVQTYIKGTKQLVYDSGRINPKEFVSKGKLSKKLSPGTYETDSKVTFLDLEDGAVEGETAFVGELIVE